MKLAMPVRTDVHVGGRRIPGPDGAPDLGIRVYRGFGRGVALPGSPHSGMPCIVYYHGGGWMVGDLEGYDAHCRMLAAVSGCLVVSVGYRLAPEWPFPAAADDSLAAYSWVCEHASELGADPARIGVMGDSAGGNLAAVVSQVASAGAAPVPAAQCLVYPATDARFATSSYRDLGDGFFLTTEEMQYFRRSYLPDETDWLDPRASPGLSTDLGGLPPALVFTAGFDPLRDEGAAYADAMAAAGVAVAYRCFDDQVHGFMGMGIVDDALALAIEVCDAMGRLLHRPDRADAGGARGE